VAEPVGASVGQAGNLVVSALCLELAERDLALAPHDEVDAAVRVLGVGLGSEAWIIAAEEVRGSPEGYEAIIEYVRFAEDSPLEGTGFEPLVPPPLRPRENERKAFQRFQAIRRAERAYM
jgi:hypothetical protein